MPHREGPKKEHKTSLVSDRNWHIIFLSPRFLTQIYCKTSPGTLPRASLSHFLLVYLFQSRLFKERLSAQRRLLFRPRLPHSLKCHHLNRCTDLLHHCIFFFWFSILSSLKCTFSLVPEQIHFIPRWLDFKFFLMLCYFFLMASSSDHEVLIISLNVQLISSPSKYLINTNNIFFSIYHRQAWLYGPNLLGHNYVYTRPR